MSSQNSIVLNHLLQNRAISSYVAFLNYGIVDLPKRISEMQGELYSKYGSKKKGRITVKKEWIYSKNKQGNPIKFMKYYL